MFSFILVLSVLTISAARPNLGVPQNVITVPPNCPEGQELINGECRDIWRSRPTTPKPASPMPINMVTVPTNCPPGQQLINGQCRDIWRGGLLAESKLFEKLMETLWAKSTQFQNNSQMEDKNDILANGIQKNNFSSKNIISVPSQCPNGFRPDALGICRPIL